MSTETAPRPTEVGTATVSIAPAEPEVETIAVEYDGETYHCPAEFDEIGFLEHVESNRIAAGIRLLIGDKNWQQFRKGHKKADHLDEFSKALQAAGVGNL